MLNLSRRSLAPLPRCPCQVCGAGARPALRVHQCALYWPAARHTIPQPFQFLSLHHTKTSISPSPSSPHPASIEADTSPQALLWCSLTDWAFVSHPLAVESALVASAHCPCAAVLARHGLVIRYPPSITPPSSIPPFSACDICQSVVGLPRLSSIIPEPVLPVIARQRRGCWVGPPLPSPNRSTLLRPWITPTALHNSLKSDFRAF